MGVEKQKLQSFAVIEMMGHRKIVGLVTESDISGGQLLRVDVLNADGEPERTEYIGVGSIYCLTIVSEEAAKAVAARNAPRPAWGLSGFGEEGTLETFDVFCGKSVVGVAGK